MFKNLASTHTTSMVFIQRLVLSKIKEALLRIEELSIAEIDAVFSIINETGQLDLHTGSYGRNDKG